MNALLAVIAVDMEDPTAVVSPGGVGFDINCGVRLLRTNLTEKDVLPVKEQLAQSLFDHIPVGVGSKGIIPTTAKDLEAALVRVPSQRLALFEGQTIVTLIKQQGVAPVVLVTITLLLVRSYALPAGNGNGLVLARRLCVGRG